MTEGLISLTIYITENDPIQQAAKGYTRNITAFRLEV
jgi:hypothetical protein